MEQYEITIIGTQPLFMHHDDVEWSDQMELWKNNKDNKSLSKAGDDRSPAWRWLGNLYHDNARVVMPTANIMKNLMEAGASVLVPGGKSGKTFKAQSQSGIMPREPYWPVFVGQKYDKEIPVDRVLKLMNEKDFEIHKQVAIDHGFKLDVRRAKIGASKHVRVRPWFQRWSIKGVLVVIDEQISESVMVDLLEIGGKFKGLGDYRPSSPKSPGPHGTFRAEIQRVD